MEKVADILKKYRSKTGLSQQEVADKLKISQRAYAFYEDGVRIPKIGRLTELGKILKIDQRILLEASGAILEANVPRENGEYDSSHTEELIMSLKARIAEQKERIDEEKRILEKHNDFLQEMWKTNLTGLKANQSLGGGVLVELLRRDVDREVKGNPEKRKKILDEIVRRIGPDFDLVTGMGTLTHDGNADIH